MLGVGGGQPGVQVAAAPFGQFRLQAGAHLRVGAGEVQGVDGTAYVQAGAADQDRGAALGEQPVDLGAGQPLVLGDAGGPCDVPDVQEAVRYALLLLGREFGGADVHAAVELHGIGVDDLAAHVLRERDAQIGLSGRGGTDDGDDPRSGTAVFTPSVSQTSRPHLERAT